MPVSGRHFRCIPISKLNFKEYCRLMTSTAITVVLNILFTVISAEKTGFTILKITYKIILADPCQQNDCDPGKECEFSPSAEGNYICKGILNRQIFRKRQCTAEKPIVPTSLDKELNLFVLLPDPCDDDPCPSGQICMYSSTMVQGNHYTCTGMLLPPVYVVCRKIMDVLVSALGVWISTS